MAKKKERTHTKPVKKTAAKKMAATAQPKKTKTAKKTNIKKKRVATAVKSAKGGVKKQQKEKSISPKTRRVQSAPSFQKAENTHTIQRTRIRVIGIGGGGGNIVSEIASRVSRVDFVAANTDLQAIRELPRNVKGLSFGQDLTHGLGCGMNPAVGEEAAKTEKEKIEKLFEGQDITILISSLGGGTGSGAAPVFADVAKEYKNLTIGIFTMPFPFEGNQRTQIALRALEKLKPALNAYIIIPNERIFYIIDKDTPLKEAFSATNRRLSETLEGLIDTIASAGLINIDFADVRATLEGRGRLAYVNSTTSGGSAKVQQALHDVLVNPLCEYDIQGVDRILFNIAGDKNLKMHEVAEISKAISDYNAKAKIVFGISCTGRFKDKIRITLFAVGCKEDGGTKKAAEPRAEEERRATATTPVKKKQRKVAPKVERKQEKLSAPPRKPLIEAEVVHRRNALEVQKAADEEIQELEERERKWDIPAFLRNKG